ncbi:MAG: glycoside hydrolase [Kiritimatiellae bacterium]|nr:glycoside hydrolase [Kiritimatiellia bacterium]
MLGAKYIVRSLCSCVLFSACAFAQPLEYTIDLDDRYQTIDNFGASDCWTTQVAGKLPDDKRSQLADWLFSTELDATGNLRGIGLSLWRFNIGAGSAEQGAKSLINNPMRRAECFLQPDNSYDWSRQAGQRWFLQAAKARGVPQFLAFCNSAPVYMTKNGIANSQGRADDRSCNLRADQYAAFAEFLATVINGIHQREGILFDYISPFNEPEWSWDNPKQEGTPAFNSEIAAVVRELDQALSKQSLRTKICVTDSGSIEYLYQSNAKKSLTDNKITAFFDPSSPEYIGGLPHLARHIAAHSYWTTAPGDKLKSTRLKLRRKLDQYALSYWQSELCIMSNDTLIGGGGGRDLTMKTALYVAGIIHHDLCLANAAAWHWWLGISSGNYKDGLVYVDFNKTQSDAAITDSRLLWAFGNFSRFVRPGSIRIGVTGAQADVNDLNGVMISAYLNQAEQTLTCVMINTQAQPRSITINPGKAGKGGIGGEQQKPQLINKGLFITSDRMGDKLKRYPNLNPLAGCELPPHSVSTWIARW